MKANFILPFGELIKKIKQLDRKQKDVFILGNYSHAVNADWISADNDTLVKNIPIASEPSIFWSGENADNIIKWVDIPKEIGSLLPAKRINNGQSGRTLIDRYLRPLEMKRDDIWLCNLVPYAQVFLSQRRDIEEFYMPLKEKYSLPMPNIPDFKTAEFRNEVRINEIMEELTISNPKLIITLGDEAINYFIRKVSDCKHLAIKDFSVDGDTYGKIHSISIDGNKYDLLPLYHPRQLDGLGKPSQLWNDQHNKWISKLSIQTSSFP